MKNIIFMIINNKNYKCKSNTLKTNYYLFLKIVDKQFIKKIT